MISVFKNRKRTLLQKIITSVLLIKQNQKTSRGFQTCSKSFATSAMGLWWTDREATVMTTNHPGASRISLPWWEVALFIGQVSAQLKTAKYITSALVVNELDPRTSLAPLAGAGEAETCLQRRRSAPPRLRKL